MINSSQEKCKENGVSPVVGVILVVAIVIILASLIGLVFLGFSDNLSTVGTTPAAVSLDDGELRITDLGASEKILVKRNNSTVEIDSVGETQNLMGGEEIVAVNDDGSETIIDTITRQEVIESGGTAGTTAEVSIKNGSLQIDNMGTAEEILVKREDSTIELTGENEKQDLFGGEEIIAEDENGDKTTLKTITEQEVIESGGTKYKNPNTLDKNDVTFTSETDHYSGSDDRILTTTEKFELRLPDNYNPQDFNYDWSRDCSDDCGGPYGSWTANIDKNMNQASYTYDSVGGYARDDDAAPKVRIYTSNISYTFSQSKYNVEKPINSVNIESTTDHYSGNEDRIHETSESWEVSSIDLNPKVSDVLGNDTPSSLNDYTYVDWDINCSDDCGGPYGSWTANIDQNGSQASYTYDSVGGYDRDDDAAPKVRIEVPEFGTEQTFSTSKYNVEDPISSVTLSGNLSDTTRNVSDVEQWEVSSIDLNSKVSDVLGNDTPSSLNDYTYVDWDINCYSDCGGTYGSWTANIDENGSQANYEYTSVGGYDGVDRKAAPKVRIEVPEFGTEQTFTRSRYYIYK